MPDPTIISESKHPEILEVLQAGNFNEVIKLTGREKAGKGGFWIFGKKYKPENNADFALKILHSCLSDGLNSEDYTAIQKINFDEEFLEELIELHRMVLVLEDTEHAPQYESQLSLTLLACIRDGAIYVEQNANHYPQNSINAKVWMEGAGLRGWAGKLAEYFKRKNNDQQELEALFLKGKLTNTIMSHYPNMVGPDMNAIGAKFEAMGNAEMARKFYQPVVLDFTPLVSDVELGLNDPEVGLMDEYIPITQSLINALEGLKRLGFSIDEANLNNAKKLMKQIESMN